MKVSKIFVAGALALLLSIPTIAQADSATDKVLDEIAGKFESMRSYRVDIRTETSAMGQPMISEGVMSFKAPDKIRMTTTSNTLGGTQEVFASGDVAYTYLPTMKTATRMDMGRLRAAGDIPEGISDFSANAQPFAGYPQDELIYIETKKMDGRKVHLFEARPYYDAKAELADQVAQERPTPDMFGDTIRFEVDAETGLLAKMTVLAEHGAVMIEHTYSNFRVNILIADAEFTFSPPADVQITDLTDGTLTMMSHMQ
ncbi:MAG: LolA family protein [Planctomycetota bacterium]|jgi:outer membrane lipoprotein-sorting protein